VLGKVEGPELAAMAKRLLHRGTESTVHEVAPNVRLGRVVRASQSGVLHYQQLIGVSDSWICNESEPTTRYGNREIDEQSRDNGLLRSYAHAGAEGLNRINGQFVLAAWDDAKKELVLARDYMGTLPLYYFQPASGGLVFASEQKALLALEIVPADPDLDMIQRLQHYKHLPTEKNLLQHIKAVHPGTVLTFSAEGKMTSTYRFPALRLNVTQMSMEHSHDVVSSAFIEAIKSRVCGLKTIGVALSGGIDSIGVAYACRQANPNAELHTFTVGYGPEDPEMQIARFVAEKIDSVHHNLIVTPQDLPQYLPLVVWHLENPIARSETVQFYKLGQEAGKYVDNIFTGAAADGLFAGMPKHKILWLMHHFPVIRKPLGEFYNLTQSGRKPDSRLGKLLNRVYFRGTVPEVPHIRGSQFQPGQPDFPPNSKEFVNEILCSAFQEGVSQWLPKVERTLGAGGVRYTSPFLDRNLIDVAFTVPSAHKIFRGKEKYVLRQALRSLVPPKVLLIPKFPMRMKYDLSFSDTIDLLADQVLTRNSVEKRGFFEFNELSKMRQRRPGRPYSSEGAMRIWTAILTEMWAQEFLDLRGERPTQINPKT